VDVYIEKISLDQNYMLFVKPKNYSFDMIHRSSMGVHWDDKKCCLYHNPTKNWSVISWYMQITLAVQNEYGATLIATSDTVYENIAPSVQKSIANANQGIKRSGLKPV